MIPKFEHHITKSLRAYYKKRMIYPVAYLCILLFLSFLLPIGSLLFPKQYKENSRALDSDANFYAKGKFENLYFTGYTRKYMGQIDGYYYYTLNDNKCLIVLLKPNSCEMGISHIESIHTSGKVLKQSSTLDTLFTNLSRDLSWSEDGVRETFYPYVFSEPDANDYSAILARVFLILSTIASLGLIIYCLICIAFPFLAFPIRRLFIFGNPREILERAEEELSTLPQLATDDMFITQHYFIETSNFGIAIVPIDKIKWIYKYSTMHRFLGKHLKISYTLYITADKSINIKCPKNTRTDIDGIIDYLSEANHDILVGFSEQNRQIVEGAEDIPDFLIALRKFLLTKV